MLSSDENYYGFSQIGTSRTVTEDIVRILEKFVCEMYGKKVTDTNLSINEVNITSTVIETEEYFLRCYHHVRIFKVAYYSSKLSNFNLEKVFRQLYGAKPTMGIWLVYQRRKLRREMDDM